MSEAQNPQPINDPHVAFARALVALARQHSVGNLQVEFSITSSSAFREGRWNGTRVKFHWSEGRHGSSSSFLLSAEAHISVTEEEERPARSILQCPHPVDAIVHQPGSGGVHCGVCGDQLHIDRKARP